MRKLLMQAWWLIAFGSCLDAARIVPNGDFSRGLEGWSVFPLPPRPTFEAAVLGSFGGIEPRSAGQFLLVATPSGPPPVPGIWPPTHAAQITTNSYLQFVRGYDLVFSFDYAYLANGQNAASAGGLALILLAGGLPQGSIFNLWFDFFEGLEGRFQPLPDGTSRTSGGIEFTHYSGWQRIEAGVPARFFTSDFLFRFGAGTGDVGILLENVRVDAMAAYEVPEPASWTLVGLGLAGLWRFRRAR